MQSCSFYWVVLKFTFYHSQCVYYLQRLLIQDSNICIDTLKKKKYANINQRSKISTYKDWY